VVQKSQDMIVRQRRVVGGIAPVNQARPVGYLEPAHDLPARSAPADAPQPEVALALSALASKPSRWRLSAGTLWVLAAFVTVVSAIGAKELGPVSPMAALNTAPLAVAQPRIAPPAPSPAAPVLVAAALTSPAADGLQPDNGTRWFNGRPVRPARIITMTVTAYSPDAASCYPYADGQTATLHGVDTNGGFLVAADTDLLPFGTMLTIEGYAHNQVVPVLDRGGAIKGNRLDLLFPTHEAALQWGVKTIDVVIWEYADGKPAVDPRKLRS
jgi:3D (Asp-Asp-Asp) domain-containing protein